MHNVISYDHPQVRWHLDVLPSGGRQPWTRHPRHFPRTSIRKGRAVRAHLATWQQIVGDDGRNDQQCRNLLPSIEHSISRCEHCVGRIEPCCRQEIGFGSMVCRFWGIQRAGLLQQLLGLSGQTIARSLRTNEENERSRRLRTHVSITMQKQIAKINE